MSRIEAGFSLAQGYNSPVRVSRMPASPCASFQGEYGQSIAQTARIGAHAGDIRHVENGSTFVCKPEVPVFRPRDLPVDQRRHSAARI